MSRFLIGTILALLAPTLLQILGAETHFVHSTAPALFIFGAALVTSGFGVAISAINRQFQKPILYGRLAASLFVGYLGIAAYMLNSGYFFWFVIPLELVLQILIARLVMRASWGRIFLVFAITVLYLLAGGYVSYHREYFGVTNEYYFNFLLFLHPHLSILLAGKPVLRKPEE